MRISRSSVIAALALLCLTTTTAFAQDETIEPEGGELGGEETGVEVGEAEGEANLETNPDSGARVRPISVGLLLGYGISLEDGNPFGFGFGVRGGYSFSAFFLGARFAYYLGEDTYNAWELGIEGGYDIAVSDNFTIRPGLGLGVATVVVEIPEIMGIPGVSISGSSSEFYIAPGASALYDVTDMVFVGLDARFMLVMSDPVFKSITLLANGGVRF